MIGVVSCVWQRPERLARLLEMLAAQSHTHFDLHLIVNNPAHHDWVEKLGGQAWLSVIVHHNTENRGPFARIELMHKLGREYDWFMTVDDDAEFGPYLLDQWWARRDEDAVQGWSGFRFTGTYWQREKVHAGDECHYLWGSNLFLPAAAVADPSILALPRRFWQCDDLWLCYHANHVAGLSLRAQQVDMNIHVDGKDTYLSQTAIKTELLEDLRRRGWRV